MKPLDIEHLLARLQSDDLVDRQQASIALSTMNDNRLIQPLLHALNDSDATVRANVATGLGTNKAIEAVEALIARLQDEVDIVRERVATALAQIGDERAIDPLIDALDDSQTWARNRIIYILGASKDPRAVEPLLEQLNSPTASTQGVSAWALGAIGDRRAIDPLVGLLKAQDASVRGNVAWALGEFSDPDLIAPLLPYLKDSAPEVRAKTAWALGSISEAIGNDSVVPDLLPLLEDYAEVEGESAHYFVCQYVAEALTQINTPSALEAVERWRPLAREHIIPRRLDNVLKALRRREPDIREGAIQQLVSIGQSAIPYLTTALQTNDNARVRQGIAQAFGEMGIASTAYVLATTLADSDRGVWSQAVGALAKLGKPAEKALRPLLNSPQEAIRLGAGIALWRASREEKAFKLVLQAIQHEDMLIRSSAISSLWFQPDERAVATLQIQLAKEEGMLARYILQALQNIGTTAAQTTIAHWMKHHNEPDALG